ncbi:MAG: HAD family phosphatase [Eubacterium sp.]|nr:HAD family phosphatase [Eubacterium sp.]
MIKNIVFDVGDVLVDFRYKDYMRDLGMDEETVEFLSQNIVLTEFWHELDLGFRTNEEARVHFIGKYPEYKDEINRFWEDPSDIVREYDYSAGLLQGLKDKGYGVYILSNYPIEISELHWPKFRFLPIADGYIISGYERMTKPSPEIYKLLESRFGIKLSECLFVDDRQVNIDGAEAVGMQAVLFTGYRDIVKRFEELPELIDGEAVIDEESTGSAASDGELAGSETGDGKVAGSETCGGKLAGSTLEDKRKKLAERKKKIAHKKQEIKDMLKSKILIDVVCPDCGATQRINVDKTPGHCYYCGRLLRYNKATKRVEPGAGQEKDIIRTQYEFQRRNQLFGETR